MVPFSWLSGARAGPLLLAGPVQDPSGSPPHSALLPPTLLRLNYQLKYKQSSVDCRHYQVY